MNGTAAIEQQQNAARRVFYMFIAMALLIIRAGVDARGGIIVIPPRVAAPDEEPSYWIDSSRRAPDHLYPAAQRFLRVASAALKRLDALVREIFELMKLADALAKSRRSQLDHDGQLRQAPEPIDSS